MIVTEDGCLVVDFSDWSGTMMVLGYIMSKLPPYPDMPAELYHSYPVGIERLRSAGGDEAVKPCTRSHATWSGGRPTTRSSPSASG
jgi:hypothetical protein